jgi:hypothetical protein
MATGLHPDDLDVGARSFQRRGDAADEPSATHRHDHAGKVRQILQKLQAKPTMSSHHLFVGKRMDERFGFRPPALGRQPVEHLVARHEDRHRAPSLHAIDLGDRRCVIHDHATAHAQVLRDICACLCGVAGADRDQPPAQTIRWEVQRCGEEAANLEASRRLEAFELEDGALDWNHWSP